MEVENLPPVGIGPSQDNICITVSFLVALLLIMILLNCNVIVVVLLADFIILPLYHSVHVCNVYG